MDENSKVKLNSIILELLDEFVRICKENDLMYFLTAGTLLGAVRHKGFIPWDDDIDIAMPRKDYEKFIDMIINMNNQEYYILSYKTDNRAAQYCKHFAKFCKTGTVFAESYKKSDGYCGIFIDIFPFDNCVMLFAPLQTLLIKLFLGIYRVKIDVIKTKKEKKLLIAKIICSIFPLKLVEFIHKKLYLVFNNYKTRYISFFSGRYGYKKETHKFEVVFPFSKLPFEGKQYCAPNNTDSFLKTLYGNYMELPPVEKRHSHSHEYINFIKDQSQE